MDREKEQSYLDESSKLRTIIKTAKIKETLLKVACDENVSPDLRKKAREQADELNHSDYDPFHSR